MIYLPGFNLEYHPFPTPDIAPGLYTTRLLRIPDNAEWIGLVSGVLSLLFYEDFWVSSGTATPEEVTQEFQEMWVAWEEIPQMSVPIGTVAPFATAVLPDGWLPCDGGFRDRYLYPDLYDVLDPIFIIDSNYFMTPDMGGRVSVGIDAHGGVNYPMGDVGGQEEVTLAVEEMPAHTHGYSRFWTGGTYSLGPTSGPFGLTTQQTGSAGDGEAHENRPPYLVLRWGIYAGGE